MAIELEKFLKENNLEYELDVEDIFPDYGDYLEMVDIGYYDEEHQAKGYFGDAYSMTANVFELKQDFASEYGFEYGVIICNEGYGNDENYLFKTKEEAMEFAKEKENSKLCSIETYIEEFKKMLNCSYEVDIKPYYEVTHPHGNFTSYNIYVDDMLVYDGAYKLHEELADDINLICQTLDSNEEKYGFKIEMIKKIKGFPSWEKLYEVHLSKGEFNTTVEVSLHFYQQKTPRNVIDVIYNEIDWDSVIEEYEDVMEL